MNKVIIIQGPTGVGKTGAAILLAKELNTEIISADSMQVYKGMDIGTAKPSLAERAGVKHHMVDIIDPSKPYSAGEYISAIVPIIDRLHDEGKIPLVVGGTGLYIKAITRGIFSGPSADRALREELLSAEQEAPGSLYARLLKKDPEAAAGIDRHDVRRIVRALEVCLKSNEKISVLRGRLTEPLPYEVIKIGLTMQRKKLYKIIDSRVDSMIRAGLTEEAERLMSMNPDRTPLQAIGYKELGDYFKKSISLEEAVSLIKRNTRRYAKRQFTWFNKEEGIVWLDVTECRDSLDVYEAVRGFLEKTHPGILHQVGCGF